MRERKRKKERNRESANKQVSRRWGEYKNTASGERSNAASPDDLEKALSEGVAGRDTPEHAEGELPAFVSLLLVKSGVDGLDAGEKKTDT